MLKRFADALDAGRKAVADAEAREVPKSTPVLALLVLDELGAGAGPVRDRHAQAAREISARPLLILGPFSEHEHPRDGTLRECLPGLEDLARSTGARRDAMAHYMAARLALILDKWDIRECRYIGERATDLADALARNPTRRPLKFRPAH